MERFPSERIALDGFPSVEVERIRSQPLQRAGIRLLAAFYATDDGDAEAAALRDLYGFFLVEAQPTWAVADHLGPIPPTLTGMLRFDVGTGIRLVQDWLETLTPKPTAADAVLPPGELRDAVNTTLRAKRNRRAE